jgi:hypothetical protein
VLVIVSKKNCMCTCVIFQMVSEMELFHCTVPKLMIRKILCTASNIGIYFSSDKVGTVYLV